MYCHKKCVLIRDSDEERGGATGSKAKVREHWDMGRMEDEVLWKSAARESAGWDFMGSGVWKRRWEVRDVVDSQYSW